MFKQVKKYLGDIKRKNRYVTNAYKNSKSYERFYLENSASLGKSDDSRVLRRAIIISSHVLEKGLSHTDFRPGFGKQAIYELQQNLHSYLLCPNIDQFAVDNAVNLLFLYHEMNRINGFDDSDYLDLSTLNSNNKDLLSPYDLRELQSIDLQSFINIAEARHSVRCYETDGVDIDKEIFESVIKVANTAPSACNRQATKVYVVTDRSVFHRIEEIQIGCKGFGRHASAFLFVTSDLTLYSRNEEKLPIFDAGIYTMNLLYSLLAHGLYACTLNASFPGDDLMKIYEATGIPKDVAINGLIAVYKLDEHTKVKIAASPRRTASETLTIL